MNFSNSEKWGNTDILFSGYRALYIQSVSTLVVSDLHLGKSGHFQQMGAAIPSDIHAADLARLSQLLLETKAQKLLINGDLFHAGITRDVPLFKEWVSKVKAETDLSELILVKGNHDRYSTTFYEELGINTIQDYYQEGVYLFIHDPSHLSDIVKTLEIVDYKIAFFGHIHAGVVLKGKGRQHIRKAAFIIEQQADSTTHLFLPAYGRLTGIKPFALSPSNQCIMTSEGQIFEL
jgi:DNA ligase-associated metallophosphoesterase